MAGYWCIMQYWRRSHSTTCMVISFLTSIVNSLSLPPTTSKTTVISLSTQTTTKIKIKKIKKNKKSAKIVIPYICWKALEELMFCKWLFSFTLHTNSFMLYMVWEELIVYNVQLYITRYDTKAYPILDMDIYPYPNVFSEIEHKPSVV